MRLAEREGEQLATVLHGIFEEIDMRFEQRRELPEIVRRHMMFAAQAAQSGPGDPISRFLEAGS